MKRVIALLASLAPGLALGYPVDVQVVSRGLDVSAEYVQEGQATIVRLTNHEPVEVRCSVRFNAGVETRTRRAVLSAGDAETIRHAPLSEVVRMRVRVECEPTETEEDTGQ